MGRRRRRYPPFAGSAQDEPPSESDALLLEDGSYLLVEDGGHILLEEANE